MKNIKYILLLLSWAFSLLTAAYPEGFVWRRSVDMPAINQDLQEMCRVERVWSAFLRPDYKHKNIALARLGILYEFDSRQHYLSTWVTVPEAGVITDKIPIFVSGSAAGIFDNLAGLRINNLHTLNTLLNFETFTNNNFMIVDNATIDNDGWYDYLQNLYLAEHQAPDKIISPELTAQRRADHGLDYRDFERLYAHSEQWVLYHFFDSDIFKANVDKLITPGSVVNRSRIRRVVLLIHTNRDACTCCSQTIAVFSRRLKQIAEGILGALPQDPLIIVSSRTGYQERRSTTGHDGHAESAVDINDPSRVVKQVTLPDFPIHYNQLMIIR